MDIMPPDNQLPPHHAPTGLKLWLTVFAIVLVSALAYLVWATNTAPDTTDNSAAVVKTSATKTVTVGDKTTFTDNELGFSVTYPKTWQFKKRSGIEGYYDGYTATALKFDPSMIDADWGIVFADNSTVADRAAMQKQQVESYRGTIATDLKEGSVKIGAETATTFSFKQGVATTMYYYLAHGTTVIEISTDGSAEQMTAAESFIFTN